MNIPLLLCLSLAAGLFVSTERKHFSTKTKGNAPIFIFSFITSTVSVIVLFIWSGFSSLSTFTILLSILFGIVTSLSTLFNLKALEIGPLSYTTVIISCSTVITAISGTLFFNEKINLSHYIGIALMVACIILSVNKGNDKKASIKWLILCLIAFTACGLIGLMQKFHQSSIYKNQLNEFLILAFTTSAIFSIILFFYFHKKEKNKIFINKDNKFNYLLLVLVIVTGVCVAVNNRLNLFLSGVMPSAVFFPIVNGGGLILTTLFALIFFKEKLSLKQWIGLFLGGLSLMFLCNVFGL